MDADNQRETFSSASGRVVGVITIVLSLGVSALALADAGAGLPSWPAALGVFVAALSWAALLRPVVRVEGSTLLLRNVVGDVRVPLAAVEDVAVRQVLAVRVGERLYTSPALGRSRREMGRSDLQPHGTSGADLARLAAESYGLFVEERIRALVREAQERGDIAPGSPEQHALADRAVRSFAVPEIVVLVVSAVAFVVLAVL